MMKPVVGVMPLWDDEKESIWMLPGYFDGISRAGGIPFMFPLSAESRDITQLADMCDGFLLTGGHDVSPALYGEKPLEELVSCCRKRDDIEGIVLHKAIKEGKPILGICRGIQFINAALGGTLYQDIPTERPSDIEHHQQRPYDVPSHAVDLVPGSPLHRLLGNGRLQVNSYHHQAVKVLAPGLEAMAYSEDGLVEALYMPLHPFLWAVQWHPEYSYQTDNASLTIFRVFAEAMKAVT